MKKSILITATPGTGKSAVCDELNRLGYKSFGIENIEGLFTMINKNTGKPFEDYDNNDFEKVKQSTWICSKQKLETLIKENSDSTVFYCGTTSNLDDMLPLFDKLFLLKVNQNILCERLSTRTSNDFAKTKEVQEWVFSWKSEWENHIKEKGAIIIDASKSIKEVTENIIREVHN